MTGISLTSSMRANLLSLKNTSSLIDMTQNRLSTGNKVNSAIDNPSSYYTARSLNNRANDLSSLLDSMGQAVSTIKAATTALETGAEILQQASAVAAQTLETAKPIVARVKTEEELLAAVNSGKQGFIVLENDITMSDNQNINLNDGQSLVGAKYFDKNAAQTTLNFNYDVSEDIVVDNPINLGNNSTISDLNINFVSNTRFILANKNDTEGALINANNKTGIKLQNLNLNVNTQDATEKAGLFAIRTENSKCVITGDITIKTSGEYTRCILARYGSDVDINNAKINNTSNNNSAFMIQSYNNSIININGNSQVNLNLGTSYRGMGIACYDGGTINVNNYSEVNFFSNSDGASALYGYGDINLNDCAKINISCSTLFNSNTDINVNINDYSNFNIATAAFGIGQEHSLSVNSASANVELNVNLNYESNIAFSAVSGAKISTQQGTYNFDNSVESTAFSDAILTTLGSLDTSQTAGFDAEASAMFADFSAHMANNVGAEIDNNISDSKQFASILNQYDALINDGSYKGVNLLKNESLAVRFNEDSNSNLNITGKDMSSGNLGVNTQNWQTAEDVAQSIAEIASAMKQIRSYNSELGNNYSIITNRQEFTENLINVLTEGADKLTLADMNEESANILALQTRQQLAINSLSLAAQSAQAVLKLF